MGVRMNKIKVRALSWEHKDPTFSTGETHTATATLTNTTGQALTITTELFLDVAKVATSGRSTTFTLNAGQSLQVNFKVTMPSAAGGPYHVYLGVWSDSNLLTLYQASDDVSVAAPAATEILLPSGPGGWTQLQRYPNAGEANWQDVVAGNDDAAYVYGVAPGGWMDFYTHAPSKYGVGAIKSVTVGLRICALSTYYSFRPLLWLPGGGGYNGTGIFYLDAFAGGGADTYIDVGAVWLVNPFTGAAWTWPDIQGAQPGVNASYVMSGDFPRCNKVWLQIN